MINEPGANNYTFETMVYNDLHSYKAVFKS